MRWLIDGYNLIRRSPELASSEQESLEAGRAALCRWLQGVHRACGDHFTVVFDGARGGGVASGGAGVSVIFSSARETADGVLGRMATTGGAVVSNDRGVRQAASRAGAIAITADAFLAMVARPVASPGAGDRGMAGESPVDVEVPDKEEEDADDQPARPQKGNPRRLPKKARAAARALSRLRRSR